MFRSAVAKNKRRIVAGGSALAATAAATALVGFPYFEDWYWYKRDPDRVCGGGGGGGGDGEGSGTKTNNSRRKKLVILGTGWGSVAAIRNIDRDKYDVTVVSPRNSFLFTPLLPCTAVGTLSQSSIAVPIRSMTTYKSCAMWQRLKWIWRGYLPPRIKYMYAYANDVNPITKTVRCRHTGFGRSVDFDINYDLLILAVGCRTNTWGTPGVDQYCHYLKENGDAMLVRQQLIDNLETAALPNTTKEQREQLLSFYIIGGGPTGVEFAAELHDFVQDDVANSKHAAYKHVADKAKITLVQSNAKLLPGYPPEIQDFAQKHMADDMNINVLTNTRVTAVNKETVTLLDKKTKQSTSVPYGLILWSAGVSPTPLAQKLINAVPEQTSKRSIKVDSHCKVLGVDDVYAIGDCSDIDLLHEYQDHATNLFKRRLSYDAAESAALQLNNSTSSSTGERRHRRLTQSANATFIKELEQSWSGGFKGKHDGLEIANKIVQDFQDRYQEAAAAAHKSPSSSFQGLSEADVESVVKENVAKQKHYPPTAQVAQQQGVYLAHLLNNDPDHGEPWTFRNRGQLVYVGSHMAGCALPGTNNVDVTWNGTLTNLFWHAAYFGMLESPSSRYELLVNWFHTMVFGRSTSVPAICTDHSHEHHQALKRFGMTAGDENNCSTSTTTNQRDGSSNTDMAHSGMRKWFRRA